METSLDSPIGIKVKKEARLEARVTIEQKQLMERAAFLRGQNLTEFMVAVLSETAIQTIKVRELWIIEWGIRSIEPIIAKI